MSVPGGVGGAEYLLTAFFSAMAAFFGYLSRRGAKKNERKLDSVHGDTQEIKHQTNGALQEKIAEAIKHSVTHDELVQAVAQEAIRDYLDGMLMAHLADDEASGPDILHDPMHIAERRKQRDD